MVKQFTNQLVVEGEVIEQPVQEYQDNYKYGSSYNFVMPEKENKISYVEAVRRTLLPTKIVSSLQYNMDVFLRSQDEKDKLEHIDLNFDPVKVWKENRLSERDFKEISQMTNNHQFERWMAQRNFQVEAEEKLSQAGFIGNSAVFIAQLATDPTTYFGFGTAKMLSKGMAAYKAYGLSGIAAGAAYEGIQQSVDDTNMRSAADSMISIGATGVISAALGGAVNAFANRAAQKGKSFESASVDIVNAVNNLEPQIGKSVGAMEVAKDPNLSVVRGFIPRFFAKAYSPLSPTIRGQVASQAESRELYSLIFGRTLQTEADYMPMAPTDEQSIVNNLVKLNNISKAEINALAEAAEKYKASGNVLDDDAYKAAIEKINNPKDNLNDGSPLSELAQSILKFGKRFADEAKDIDDFNFRERFFPSMYSHAKITENYSDFVKDLNKIIKNAHKSIPSKITRIQNKIKKMEDELSKVDDPLLKYRKRKVEEELSKLKVSALKTPEQLEDDARAWAEMFLDGNFTEGVSLDNYAVKNIPSHFKERVFDQKRMLKYLEVNPFKVYATYARDVIPHIASHKTLDVSTPDAFVENYKMKMTKKITDLEAAGKNASKLRNEMKRTIEDISSGWSDITGATSMNVASAGALGKNFFNISKALKNFTAATGLSSSIFSMLPEFGATMIIHALKGQKEFVRNMTSLGKSAKALQMKKADARHFSYGMSFAAHKQMANVLSDEFLDYGIRGGGASAVASKAMSFVNHWAQYGNGQMPVTGWIRNTVRAAQQGIFRESLDMLAKGRLSEKRAADLKFLGINQYDAKQIMEQVKKYSESDKDGAFRFATENWEDRYLADKVDMMLLRDNRRISLDPQVGDVPHVFRVSGIELLFQFKSWAVTAGHTYGIASIQRMDAQNLIGVTGFFGWAGLSYMMAEIAKGNEPPTDFDEIMYSAVTNSGFLGVLPDYGGHALMNTLFDLESGGARFVEGKDFTDYFAPPVAGKLNSVAGLTEPLFDAIDPNEEAEINDRFFKDLLNASPLPFIKPYINNELLTDD